MFIRTVLTLVLVVFTAGAQAQLRPLAERAVPKQELRVKHPNGISRVTVYLGSRTNSGVEVANVMSSVGKAIKKVCPESCTAKDETKLEEYVRVLEKKVVDIKID